MTRPAAILAALTVWTAACSEPNQAPFSCGATPPQAVDMRDSISFLPCFADPDADPLTITAEVANHLGPYLAASAAGETVTIHGKREHALLPISVIATDPAGLYAVEEVDVTVRGLHDLAVLDAWPDTQTVRDGYFELHFEIGNVGETHARRSEWTVRVSSDPLITIADSILPEAIPTRWVILDMAPGAARLLSYGFQNLGDPGKPYFGLCGESATHEYNLANNCSQGLRVVFPYAAAGESRHPPPTGSPEVTVRQREQPATQGRR